MRAQSPYQRSGVDRTSAKYWAERVYHRSWAKEGQLVEANSYYVRIKHHGQRRDINLLTGDKAEAAKRATAFYAKLIGQGWDAAMATVRAPGQAPKTKSCTVGEYIKAARGHFQGLGTTFEDYARNFRLIVLEALKVSPADIEERALITGRRMALRELRRAQKEKRADVPPRLRYRGLSKQEQGWIEARAYQRLDEAVSRLRWDHRKEGRNAWAAAAEAVPLSKVTPAVINRWATARIKAAEAKNPTVRKRAKVSVETIKRQARSLFSEKKILKHVRTEIPNLPEVLPFDGVERETTRVKRFRPQVGLAELMSAATTELAGDREAMKAFLLGAFGGLRKREMDALTWAKVNTKRNLLWVEVSEHGRLKTEDSERELPLAPEAMEFLAQCQKLDRATRGDFVIQGTHSIGQRSRGYRCQKVFERLISWLRGQDVDDLKPIHYLRKLAGETLAEQAGIYAASSYLGHSSVKVTQEYYATGRPTVAPDMNRLMGRKIIIFPNGEQKPDKPKRRKAG